VRLWDRATQRTRIIVRGHRDPVYGVAFRPDGKRLASAGGDRAVRLWDEAAGKEQAVFKEAGDAVFAVAFSPDGQSLAWAGDDQKVRVRSLASAR
jgi:WD40 repeat protein